MPQITREEQDAITNFLNGCDVFDVSWRNDYTGRGMYNQKCVGIVVDDCNELLVGIALAEVLGGYEAVEITLNGCSDSMGMSTIYYWPDLEFDGEHEVGEDLEDDDDE